MTDGNCFHVLNVINKSVCDLCNRLTNEINWQLQNELKNEWHINNPNAKYEGWMSI